MSKYGCHNKPRPTANSAYIAQRGWLKWDDSSRYPVHMLVKSAFGTTDCQYTKTHASDKHCAGCMHQANNAA